MISDSVLPPSYSMGSPLMKNFNVGYPETSNRLPSSFCSVASTFAKYKLSLLKVFAALEYSGANFLQ